MEEAQTWRELLSKVTAEPQERQRIAEAMGINPVTLMRWITGKSNPRQDNLRPLLDALPHYRQQFTELIAKEFPHFFVFNKPAENLLEEIPSAFYARVLNAHINSPLQLRTPSVCTLILQQLLGHLDPQRLGLAVSVFQCVAPEPGGNVHSLQKTFSRISAFPQIHNGSWTLFLGAESQAGHALIRGYPSIVQSSEEKLRTFPAHYFPGEESTAIFPIFLNDRVAGCLGINSTQPNYFTQAHRNLIQNYVELMVLAFEPHEFYHLNSIELGIMPRSEFQQQVITTFHQRVTYHLIKAAQNQQALTRPVVEQIAWREIEEDLLHFPGHNHQEPPA